MRPAIIGFIAAVLLSFGTAYLYANGTAQQAAVGASVNAQASSIIFDTSRIVELLKALLSVQAPALPSSVTVPYATTTPSASAVPVTTVTTTPAKKPATVVATAPSLPQLTATQRLLSPALPPLRSALVNIICQPVTPGGTLRGISGSGVIIGSHGIILTVAHVAQYELLAEARPDLVTCTVRTGSPAVAAYVATPVYVSGEWVSDNAETISSAQPRGTGENDFALLAITAGKTSAALPVSFPFVSISSAIPAVKDPVVIGSYAAEFLTSARIRTDLFPTLVFGSVQDRFTFDTDTVDLISLGGGAAAQEGSSGGGIVNASGQLIGLITTSSNNANLQDRDLHAITSSYVRRALKQQSGTELNTYITSSDIGALVDSFRSKANKLAATLVKANGL